MNHGGKRQSPDKGPLLREAARALARIGVFFLAFASLDIAQAQQPAATAMPIAYSVRIEPGPRETRLVFTLNSCVAAESYVLDRPARAIVDLAEVNFQIDPSAGLKPPQQGKARRHAHGRRVNPTPAPSEGLVASYRFGRLAPGKSRIVIDLSAPAELHSATCAVNSAGLAELVLALSPQAETAFRTAARAGAEKQAAALPAAAAPQPPLPGMNQILGQNQPAPGLNQPIPDRNQKPIIVLDPGHGGVDNGALGRDHVVEKWVVLEFAKALAAKLRESGHYKVVLTREDDTFVPLGERVRMARGLDAALFVSLHADSLAGGGDNVQGATVYTVSDRASDAEAARIAEHENSADAAAGVEAKEDASDVNDILFDLTRRETRAFSHVFAHSLAEYWKVAARLNKNPRRSAGFVVLKAPDVPSVLLELGYLSNDSDVADLTSADWRGKATTQVARAIDAFFSARSPEKSAAPAPDGALKATQSTGN
jgi:N-acetylmuramoyl-L-alanine amidase